MQVVSPQVSVPQSLPRERNLLSAAASPDIIHYDGLLDTGRAQTLPMSQGKDRPSDAKQTRGPSHSLIRKGPCVHGRAPDRLLCVPLLCPLPCPRVCLVSGTFHPNLKESFRILQTKCSLVWGEGRGQGSFGKIMKTLSNATFGLCQCFPNLPAVAQEISHMRKL